MAKSDGESLKEAVTIVCSQHPMKAQCEELVASMVLHGYAIGQTQTACNLNIKEACEAKKHNRNFDENVQWFEQLLRNP